MLNAVGNVWAFADTHDIVVPISIGWTQDCQALLVGDAREAGERYPELADWYGVICFARELATGVVRHPKCPVIMFPVRTIDTENPADSWLMPIDFELLKRSLDQLTHLTLRREVAIPIIGVNDGLAKTTIPMLRKLDDRFMLVRSRPFSNVRKPTVTYKEN